MKVNRANLNRKIFSLKDFRGVDYASSPMEVKPYRTTDMANLLLKDGMLHKRNGLKQISRELLTLINNLAYTYNPSCEIKCFPWGAGWSFESDEDARYVIQYLDKSKKMSIFSVWHGSLMFGEYVAYEVDRLGSTVSVDDALYIFCGKIIRVKGERAPYEFEEIGEESAYVPTTTINIPLTSVIEHTDEENSQNNYYASEADPSVKFPMQSNESLNMLTSLRKNRFIVRQNYAYEDMPSTSNRYFLLDGKIMEYEEEIGVDWDVQYPWRIPSIVTLDGEIKFEGAPTGGGILDTPDSVWLLKDYGLAICRRYAFLPEGILDPSSWEDYHVLVVYDAEKFKLFLAELQADSSGYVQFDLQYFEITSGDNADKVTSCSVATTFGVDGADDRIFVSGGKDLNIVYISSNDISLKPNPTYFPADQFLVCGTSGSTVNGFMKITDGTMAIFKDVRTVSDVAVYYTSGYYQTVGTGEEGNTYNRAVFTVKAGDIQRKGISAKGIVNFEGDNIFVANDGVYGIQLSSNVASGERYAKERSRTINPKIRELNLSNAKTIVYKDRFYMAVDNGEVYVADARYRFTLAGDQQDTFNYEWFRLTDLRVKEWIPLKDNLGFIDADGYLCEFTSGFADCYMVTTGNGELVVNNDGTVTFNSKRLNLIKSAEYAVDDDGDVWTIELTKDGEGNDALKVPLGIEIEDSANLTLWFHVPIRAYWQSAVLDLENPMIKKNMWSLAVTASAEHGGMINLGYKTRMKYVNDIDAQGFNANTFDDNISLFGAGTNGFGMHTFDTGGFVGINTYRRRVFERNFIFLQLLFESNTVSDCVVNEIDVEYAIARKNIGVG